MIDIDSYILVVGELSDNYLIFEIFFHVRFILIMKEYPDLFKVGDEFQIGCTFVFRYFFGFYFVKYLIFVCFLFGVCIQYTFFRGLVFKCSW